MVPPPLPLDDLYWQTRLTFGDTFFTYRCIVAQLSAIEKAFKHAISLDLAIHFG
jgi:hypothetical protein